MHLIQLRHYANNVIVVADVLLDIHIKTCSLSFQSTI